MNLISVLSAIALGGLSWMQVGTAFADVCQPKPENAFSRGSFYQLSGGEDMTLVICSDSSEFSVERIKKYRDEISCGKSGKTIDGEKLTKGVPSNYAVVFIGSGSGVSNNMRHCIHKVSDASDIQEDVVIDHLRNPIQHRDTIDMPTIPGVSRYVPSVRTRYFYDNQVPFAVIHAYRDYVPADVISAAIFGIKE
ncbi:hypothetical protein [Paracoccus sp. (in: a-proteobacteria)]|uniref:hypothetical protein n=1 Tax=Paracoccus sp. TaxID=267 RepID=UPI0026DFD426|nr:hypothetical protein [Paracoccus sp. (in: a-proteobacteria)]MDO5646913.1 hypothetical protein [Paracoccus sp. (in: a-proteobacteria)]